MKTIDQRVDESIARAERENRKLGRYINRRRRIVRIKRLLGFDVSKEIGILGEGR